MENIKYLIILKDDKEESKYESSNTNIIIQEYKLNTNYEVKISIIVDGEINEDFNEIKRFKTYELNNNIFKKSGGLFKLNTNNSNLFGNNINKGCGLFGAITNNNVGNLFGNNSSSGTGLFGNHKSNI